MAGQKFLFTSWRCCINDYEVLSQFSNKASTNSCWSVTEKGFWGIDLKFSLAASFLFCSPLHYFNAGDLSSISLLFWHGAILPTPLFSNASCTPAAGVTSASSIFEVYSFWDFSAPKKGRRPGESPSQMQPC